MKLPFNRINGIGKTKQNLVKIKSVALKREQYGFPFWLF